MINAKLFVVCHDINQSAEALDLPSPFMPICVGNKKDDFPHSVLRDDKGENISNKNSTFNETTAIYWIYKHLDEFADVTHIGIVHYRRFFAFDNPKFNYLESENLSDEIKRSICVEGDKLERIFEKHDFIAPLPAYRKSVRDNYNKAHNAKDIDLVMGILEEKYPDMLGTAERYFDGNRVFFFNMFVFERDAFKAYCEWLFDVLFELEKRRENKTDRMFISERLTGIYIQKLIEEGKTPAYLPIVVITGKRRGASQAVKQARTNDKNGSSLKYIVKPVVEGLIPRRLQLWYRARKYKMFANLKTKI